ncbi:MAG: putative cobaltochelatase [bacterium]
MSCKAITFPFTAIVGQERMKKALILNAINTQISGVLIRGEKGTAKSTAARALANLLPEIEVVKDCPFSCHPEREELMCEQCRNRKTQGENLPVIKRKIQVVNLPVGSTEDRVVGTLDIEHALKTGEKRFEPGVLADANRAILYVDEVNLLDDHIVDVLLDSAAMGINTIEREGVSYSHPAHFILIGTMNPEEGELRPQLLDRFGLCVNIEGIDEPKERVTIIKRREQFEEDPAKFAAEWEKEERRLSEAILTARRLLKDVVFPDDMLDLIAKIAVDMRVDGHRADIFMVKTAKTIAAFNQRTEVTEDDVKEAAEFVLPHRIRKKPHQGEKTEQQKLEQTFKKHKEEKKQTDGYQNQDKEMNNCQPQARQDASKETLFDVDRQFQVKELNLAKERELKEGTGRRSKTISDDKRGRYIKSCLPKERKDDIAFDATFRAAAPHQIKRNKVSENQKIIITPQDIRQKQREKKVGNLIVFVVDASGSMGASQRMSAAKGAILSLLTDSYQKRDRVSMVSFKQDRAEVLLPLTNSVELASQKLSELPTGGRTPLSSGLQLGFEIIKQELRKNKRLATLMVLVSDGKANVSIEKGGKPFEEAKAIAYRIKEARVKSLVIDTERGFVRLGRLQELSLALGGKYYSLEEIKAENVSCLIREFTEV